MTRAKPATAREVEYVFNSPMEEAVQWAFANGKKYPSADWQALASAYIAGLTAERKRKAKRRKVRK